jgi:hypothetical protein
VISSGWWDLNPRPVAAATALRELIEIISASPALVISLALCRFCPSGKAFTMDENPWGSMFRRLGATSVMAANTLRQIRARTHIAASGFLAAQHVAMKHSAIITDFIGLVGFEPTASWSRTRRSTKLSHSPKTDEEFARLLLRVFC